MVLQGQIIKQSPCLQDSLCRHARGLCMSFLLFFFPSFPPSSLLPFFLPSFLSLIPSLCHHFLSFFPFILPPLGPAPSIEPRTFTLSYIPAFCIFTQTFLKLLSGPGWTETGDPPALAPHHLCLAPSHFKASAHSSYCILYSSLHSQYPYILPVSLLPGLIFLQRTRNTRHVWAI